METMEGKEGKCYLSLVSGVFLRERKLLFSFLIRY